MKGLRGFQPGHKLGKGRPKAAHTIDREKARELLVRTVVKNLRPILKSQVESAKGLWYEKITPTGSICVYKERPNTESAKYLIDQTIGKAKESIQIESIILQLDV